MNQTIKYRTRFPSLLRPLVITCVAVFAGMVVGPFLNKVSEFGEQIWSLDMKLDYGKALVWALLLGSAISILPFERETRRALQLIWVAKCFVTLGFMLLYENNYGLDAYDYYYLGMQRSDYWTQFTGGSGTHVVKALTSFLSHEVLFLDSYHALKVFYSAFGLVGSYFLYRASLFFSVDRDIRGLYFFSLFPSVIFWGSILGKDPPIFSFISIFVFGAIGWIHTKHWKYVFPILIGLVLASFIRLWMAPILLAPFFIHKLIEPGRWIPKIIISGILFYVLLSFFSRMSEYFSVESTEDLLNQTNAISSSWSRGGSAQEVPEFNDFSAVLKFAPLAMFTALFRPLPGEVMNPFGILAGLESTLVLFLVCYSLFIMRGRFWKDATILWALSTLFFWSFIYGFVSYQNLGSGYRFRLQAMPFILILCMYVFQIRSRLKVRSEE